MAVDNEFFEDKFKPLAQFGKYVALPNGVDEYGGDFDLRLDRSYGLVVIQLKSPERAIFQEQFCRLWQHLRELKTFSNESAVPGKPAMESVWVCRGVLSQDTISVPSMGLYLYHHLRHVPFRITNGDGVPVRSQQDKINDLENFAKRFKKEVVNSVEQLIPLIETIIGVPERVISSQPEQANTKASKGEAKGEANPEAEGEAQPDILNDDDGRTIHLSGEAKKIVPSKPLSRLFPPIGEVNVIAGQENSGKTSLLMNEVVQVSEKVVGANTGVNVLILSYDLRYEFLSQYLLAYGCKDNRVIVIDKPKSWEYVEEQIKEYSINALVLDSMLDFFSTYSPLFLGTSKDGRDSDFDPDKQLMWVKAFSWFLPIIQEYGLSVIGVLHAPKGRYAHGLPHSAKLGGYLWNWYCLYRKGRDMQAFPARWLAERFDGANKNTQMLFQGRERLGIIKHWFYEYGDEVDRSLLNEKVDFVPRKLVNWVWQQEDDDCGDDDDQGYMTGRLPSIPAGDDLLARLINSFDIGSWFSFSKIADKVSARDDQRKAMLMFRLRELVAEGRIQEQNYRKGRYRYKVGAPSNED